MLSDNFAKQRFVIWGIGRYFFKEAPKKPTLLQNTVAFCDSNKPQEILSFLEKPFISPEHINDYNCDKIVIASELYADEIRETLIKQFNIEPLKLIHIDDILEEHAYPLVTKLQEEYWAIKGSAVNERLHTAGQLTPKSLSTCRVLANRTLALEHMPKNAVVAEVGVAYGGFSEQILKHMQPKKFYAIDYFNQNNPYTSFWGLDYFERDNMPHQQWYENKFQKEIAVGQLETCQGFSWDVLSSFPNEYFDYVYVDAAHDYKSVQKDIAVLQLKVKDGGYIQFNDYTIVSCVEPSYYGVVPAVNEFVNNGNHEVLFLCLQFHGYNDIVVKVKK